MNKETELKPRKRVRWFIDEEDCLWLMSYPTKKWATQVAKQHCRKFKIVRFEEVLP